MAPIVRSCGKCDLAIDIDVDQYTVCEGKCAKSYHRECANLSEAELRVLSANIMWMCNGCLRDFCRYREKTFADATMNTSPCMSVEAEIEDLKCTVAAIAKTLGNVIQQTGPVAPHSSTPVSSPSMLDGCDESLDNRSESERTQVSPNTRQRRDFALYLSRIDKCASESDVTRMVCRSLAAPSSACKEVVRLVPKWKDIGSLDYVSFKVLLDEKWKSSAMLPSTWPKRVKSREFVHRLNETWKPDEDENS